ncbi:MAG TPA: type II secretion system F family protein [Planctomycetaceae bacterium]|nr:type II secretion system F family protein [Planctomycetaceae bacterium]
MDPSLIIIGFAGIAAAALGWGLTSVIADLRQPALDARLTALLTPHAQTPRRSWLRAATWRERIESSLHVLGRAAEAVRRFLAVYEQADLPLSLPHFGALVLGLGLVGSVLMPVYLGDSRFIPVGGLTAGGLPVMWMLWRRKQRLRRFSVQLPEALALIARAIRSGHSLNAAMRSVTEEMLPPVTTEFRRVCDAVSLGTPLETALETLLLRVPSDDMRFFVTAVQIQKQSGGNLGDVLDKIGECVRERFRIEGQVQALTGEGRISGIVLMVMPVALFFTMLAINPEYVNLLFNDPLGQQLLQVAVALQVVGGFVIQKVVKIDV